MPLFTKGAAPWNSLDDNTRAPLASELEGGYPCGQADQSLFNFTTGYPWGQIHNVLLSSGVSVDFSNLLQLARAIQSQKMNYAVAVGTANALVASLSPAPSTLSELVGVPLRVLLNSANTGAATFTVNGFAPVAIANPDGTQIIRGQLPGTGVIVDLVYNGTFFELLTIPRYSLGSSGTVIFTSSGLWRVPDSVWRVHARVWGGGGGSGGAYNGGNSGGGGGGGYAEGRYDVTPGQVIPVTIGAGGAAGAASANPTAGGTGGTSSFGAFCSALGGFGGQPSNGVGVVAAGGSGNGATGGNLLNVAGGASSGGLFGVGAGGGNGGAAYAIPGIPSGGYGNSGVAGPARGGGAGGTGAPQTGANYAGGPGGRGEVILEF